ncbi:MAG: transglycosylase domain-containing protein [Xenococcaceae cyanobacterium]
MLTFISKLRKRSSKWFWLGLVVSMGIGSGAIALGWGWYKLESSLPDSVDDVLTYAREGTLTIQAADGTVLTEIGPVTHEKLKVRQVPEHLIQAFVASEDGRFQEHKGVDYQGIVRAIYSNLQAGEVVEGGSTITQQLGRIVFLNQERSLWRKLKEMRLAQKIEQKFDKEQILERYLNLVYLGSGAYGVADAAWVYFSKSVGELTLPEAATLAGIGPAPSVYSPFENEKGAKERRNLVIKRMQEEGFITASEAAAAIASPLVTKRSQPKRLQRQAPYFSDYIKKELPKYISPAVLKTGGVRVETTLNPKWQKAAEETVEKSVERYGRWQRFSQAALVAIDPRSGQIKAMVGGKDFDDNQYNRVTQAQRQPGSTFKTFVYSTAIAAGFSPNQSFLDAEYFIDGYQPRNYGNTYRRGYVSMRNALISSINVVAVKALMDVGWNPTIKIAKKMGIESELKPTYSLALGASEVNLLELTSAYATLANKGVHQKAYGISRILDREGNVIYEADFQPEQALDEESAAIVTWMLRGVVASGTGQGAQIGRPVAGKTGTSDKSRDLWFIGYIPQVVAGVWLGNDDNEPTWGASSTAAAVWRQFMIEVVKEMPVEAFPALPKQLSGREGIIEAEPVKPKRSYYKQVKRRSSPSRSRSRASSRITRRSRPRRRSVTSNSKPVQNRAPRQVAPPAAPAPKAPSAPVPVINKPSKTAPAPVAAPAPAPAPEFVPPAPPASRKKAISYP